MCTIFILTVDGSFIEVSISISFTNTFPQHARHKNVSNDGILSRNMTPVTNLNLTRHESYNVKDTEKKVISVNTIYIQKICRGIER